MRAAFRVDKVRGRYIEVPGKSNKVVDDKRNPKELLSAIHLEDLDLQTGRPDINLSRGQRERDTGVEEDD